MKTSSKISSKLLILFFFWSLMVANEGNNFYKEVDITWGDDEHGKILNNGRILTLSLDQSSGSAVQSKAQYLYGQFDVKIKLVPGNSAGIVTAYYLRSEGTRWDEIDIEFLGNLSGDPYILHTNVYTQGKGEREEKFYLWFDPTADFHSYSILWNPLHVVVWYVDGRPIREFKKMESTEIPYPNDQPMRLQASIWNADDWATRGGTVKTNWTESPFSSSFKSYKPVGCIWSSGKSSCVESNASAASPWLGRQLHSSSLRRLQWVRDNYLIYNYCTDLSRFPLGLPLECTQNSLGIPNLLKFTVLALTMGLLYIFSKRKCKSLVL